MSAHIRWDWADDFAGTKGRVYSAEEEICWADKKNLRLIAAAPDMAALLMELLPTDLWLNGEPFSDKAAAVLEKAGLTGRVLGARPL